MIKISANLSKKVPMRGIEFSSQQYGASMEVEVSDADQPEALHARIRDLYSLLSQSVDEQIAGATQHSANGYQASAVNVVPLRIQSVQSSPPPVQQCPAYANGNSRNRIVSASNGNGNGRSINASQAQCRAIYAICKSQGIDMASVLADFNVADPKDLPIKDASRLIDQLKNGNAAAH